MKKICVALALVSLLICCAGNNVNLYQRQFAPPDVIKAVDEHSLAIAVYYYLTDAEYEKRLAERKNQYLIMSDTARQFWDVLIPVKTQRTIDGKPVKCIAYIGSAMLLKDNYALSVRHMFVHDEGSYGKTIWTFKKGMDHAVEADIVAISKGETAEDDYAVIKLREDLGLRGLRIAETEVQKGEKVIFGGSVGGTAFFIRFGYATTFRQFFKKDINENLHLSHWYPFEFICIYPSGGGDSGSSIVNLDGEIVGISYCGVSIYGVSYVFSNPLHMLWDFLREYHLEWLAR